MGSEFGVIRNKIIKLVFFLLLLLVGCNPTVGNGYIRNPSNVGVYKVIPVYIDVTFGEGDKVAIDDAVNQWNYVLNGYMELKVVTHQFDMELNLIREAARNNGILIMKVYSNNPIVPTLTSGMYTLNSGAVPIAWVNERGGGKMYLIRDRLENTDVLPVSLHELGHALGAGHEELLDENVLRLMYPYYYKRYNYSCIDKNAMKKVAEYQNLPWKGLNYCEKLDNSQREDLTKK